MSRYLLKRIIFIALFIMSKNGASRLPKLVALIVLSAVLPDWECKSAAFFFNMQATDESILKVF